MLHLAIRRGVAQSGRALGSGPRGRWFESSRPDQLSPLFATNLQREELLRGATRRPSSLMGSGHVSADVHSPPSIRSVKANSRPGRPITSRSPFDRCVLPLFIPDGNRPERLGSGVLVRLFGIHFVVRAAHIPRGSEGARSRFCSSMTAHRFNRGVPIWVKRTSSLPSLQTAPASPLRPADCL
jgi:hypothetical protein